MLAKSLLTLAALFAVACSDDVKPHDGAQAGAAGIAQAGAAGMAQAGAAGMGDARLIVPEGLAVIARPGANSVFNIIAVTVLQGTSGELYAAVRNDGDSLACNASFSVELHDQDDQVIAVGISGLSMRRFYQLTDGSGMVAGCSAPGDVTMVAFTDLSLHTPLADARSVVYASQYWGGLPLAPIEGVTLAQVTAVTRGGGVAYTGNLINQQAVVLSHPTVAIYPVNAVGRPLGVAYAGAMLDVPPAGSWPFETNSVGDPGVGFEAYPMSGL